MRLDIVISSCCDHGLNDRLDFHQHHDLYDLSVHDSNLHFLTYFLNDHFPHDHGGQVLFFHAQNGHDGGHLLFHPQNGHDGHVLQIRFLHAFHDHDDGGGGHDELLFFLCKRKFRTRLQE